MRVYTYDRRAGADPSPNKSFVSSVTHGPEEISVNPSNGTYEKFLNCYVTGALL